MAVTLKHVKSLRSSLCKVCSSQNFNIWDELLDTHHIECSAFTSPETYLRLLADCILETSVKC